MYEIRAHHGLCISFFRGEGYSEKFVANMLKITNELKSNPKVKIIACKDMVCNNCPNLESDECIFEPQITVYDKIVLKLCEIEDGLVINWVDFIGKVKTNIIQKGKMKEICGECKWSYICFEKHIDI